MRKVHFSEARSKKLSMPTARRPYRATVARFRQELERSRRMLAPSEEDWQAAWAAYANSPPAGPGIVDQVSFIVMRRLGITDAFTNDRHFAATEFNSPFLRRSCTREGRV